MQKTRKRIFVTAFLSLALMLTVFLGVGTLEASAATSSTPVYTTMGTYAYGDTTYNGTPSEFKITMNSSSASGTGTLQQDILINWSYYYIKVDSVNVTQHIMFELYKDGSLYTGKELTGNSDMTLFSGSLSTGNYELRYAAMIMNSIIPRVYVYTYRFSVDNTAPSYTLKAGGSTISSGTYTNKQVVFTASDAYLYRIRYKSPSASTYAAISATSYTVAATAANQGWWYVYAEDYMGNTTPTCSFYMDVTNPTGTVTNASGSTISNGGYAKSAIKYTASDSGSGISSIQYKSPSSSSWTTYTAGTAVTGTGWHTWRAYDRSSNLSSEYTVYYDSVAPTGTLYGGTTSKAHGSYTNADYVKYVASDSASGVANCYVQMPGSTYYTAYASGTQLATEGEYYFYSVDRSNNSSDTIRIILDKTPATGTLYAGNSVVNSGTVTSASYIKYVPSDNIALGTSYVMKPGATSYVAYTSGTQFTEEGVYQFYTLDAAQNRSETYEITINRDVPSAQLFVDEKAIGNGGYTNGDHIKFESNAAQCFVKLPDSDTFVEYLPGAEYYKAGKYTFYGVSESAVSTGYYTVIIDRTVKTVDVQNVTDGVTNGDVVITWTDGDAELYAPIKSVTINGKAYNKGQTIYTIDTATYTVEVEDAGGNRWTTEFRSTKKNVLTDTLQKEYYEIYDANGDYYAFTTYENALAFATARERSYVRTGEWTSESWDAGIAMDAIDSENAVNGTYYIYKKSGNTDEWVAYFTEERLNEVIAEYAKVGIVDYFYWEKIPATAGEGENLYSFSDEKNILASSITLGGNIAVLIDGESFIGSVYDVEGKALLTVCDEWGNTCDYNLTVIRKAPEILYTVGEGNINPASYDRTYYLKDKVTVSITDSFDEWAMFSVYDENDKLIGNFNLTDTYEITASGKYTVVAVNHYGESEAFTLIISRDAPKVSVTENAEEKRLDIVVTKSVDDESHIQTLVIFKSTDGGNTWVEVEMDDYGTVVSTKNLAYSFRTSAIYKVEVTDEFRSGIDTIAAQLDYVQENPEGTLVGVDNNGYTNGTVTFKWTDEAIVVLTKDGVVVPYESGDELTEDGAYTLNFENFDGYKATYAFTIDTKAPEIKTEGADHRESVNEDVKVFYTEENLTAELFKNGKSLGEYTSGNPISSDGQYRIRVSDQANNVVEVEFTIDKTVDYAINVNDKGLSNSVIATANETVTVSLTKNGEAMEYALGAAITEPADYVLVLTDGLGNRSEISFKIIQPLVKEFTHNFDEVEGFGGVLVNGEDHRLNYGTLELKEDGVYEVGVIVGGNTYLFTVEVDGTAPTVTLNGVENGGETKDAVTVTAPSETSTVKVYKDGEEIKYTIGDEITEAGAYRIIVEDEVGNSTEYSFEIVEGISGWVIFLIVLGSLLLVGGIVVFILKKKEII